MDRSTWLRRLIGVRIVVFTVFVAREPTADTQKLLLVVFALSLCWLTLLRLKKWYVGQAYLQIIADLLLITWGVNRTGGADSYFASLYFLVIVMSSILLERRGAFLTATLSSLMFLVDVDLVYFGWLPSTSAIRGDLATQHYVISLNIFGFCSVAFLSNFLAESWRQTGVELKRSAGRVAFLQSFSDRIVDSMGSGLITTD